MRDYEIEKLHCFSSAVSNSIDDALILQGELSYVGHFQSLNLVIQVFLISGKRLIEQPGYILSSDVLLTPNERI